MSESNQHNRLVSDCRKRARCKWNALADGYNQWSELGEDEKQKLTEAEANAEVTSK